jgi:prepilin-type N-terminal cleavage/methylation domain-containing protein
MIHKNKSKKGFTLVEIMVAALIITITAGGTFAAYLYARQYSDKFRHRAMAQRGAQEIAEYIRYRLVGGYKNNVYLNTTTGSYDKDTIAPTDSGSDSSLNDMLDPANWRIKPLVNNLNISYTVSDVWFDNDGIECSVNNGTNPKLPTTRPAFKKLTVRVTYDNRRST